VAGTSEMSGGGGTRRRGAEVSRKRKAEKSLNWRSGDRTPDLNRRKRRLGTSGEGKKGGYLQGRKKTPCHLERGGTVGGCRGPGKGKSSYSSVKDHKNVAGGDVLKKKRKRCRLKNFGGSRGLLACERANTLSERSRLVLIQKKTKRE